MSQFRAQIFREITTSIKRVICRVYCRYRMIYPELKWILTRNGNELLTLNTVLNFFFQKYENIFFFQTKVNSMFSPKFVKITHITFKN